MTASFINREACYRNIHLLASAAGLTSWAEGKPRNPDVDKLIIQHGGHPLEESPHQVQQRELRRAHFVIVMEAAQREAVRTLGFGRGIILLSNLANKYFDIPNARHSDQVQLALVAQVIDVIISCNFQSLLDLTHRAVYCSWCGGPMVLPSTNYAHYGPWTCRKCAAQVG